MKNTHLTSNNYDMNYNAIIHKIGNIKKGNYVTTMEIDSNYGYIICGYCTGTVKAYKIPSINDINNNVKHKVIVLNKYDDFGVTHIYINDNKIVVILSYQEMLLINNYDKNNVIRYNIGSNGIFNYDVETQPEYFYSLRYDNIVYIYSRGSLKYIKINLDTIQKQVININKLMPSRCDILHCNKYQFITRKYIQKRQMNVRTYACNILILYVYPNNSIIYT